MFESDVPVETRNLIDLYEDDDEPSTGHCVMNFDIEVSMEGDLPDTEKANNPVTAIAWHDSCTNNYVVLILDKENKITEIKLHVPGKDLFAKKQCKSFEEATNVAVEALRRQIMKDKK